MIMKMFKRTLAVSFLFVFNVAYSLDTMEEYVREYPNMKQVEMMNEWLKKNKPGTFTFTGLVDPTDKTVVTPQATVDYGYNWFSVSKKPAILSTPKYEKFFSVSIFDMKHNIPAVIVNPEKPIFLRRPGQEMPDMSKYHIVNLETDQALAFTRMVVVDNMKEVRKLSKQIKMKGGDGNMYREVQRFSPHVVEAGNAIIKSYIPLVNPDIVFGKVSGDIGEVALATGVMIGQLGTPNDSVRYALKVNDSEGNPLEGENTYTIKVPAGIVKDEGYFSITAYDNETKLLIPNKAKIYDRTTYSSEKDKDGGYTITLSPDGKGKNAIPTGNAKNIYYVLRAYVPAENSDMNSQAVKAK